MAWTGFQDASLTTVAARLKEFIQQDVQAKAARVDSDPFRKVRGWGYSRATQLAHSWGYAGVIEDELGWVAKTAKPDGERNDGYCCLQARSSRPWRGPTAGLRLNAMTMVWGVEVAVALG
jgi:hypothetical protein